MELENLQSQLNAAGIVIRTLQMQLDGATDPVEKMILLKTLKKETKRRNNINRLIENESNKINHDYRNSMREFARPRA